MMRTSILGISISQIDYIGATEKALHFASTQSSFIIYAANVHMLMEAYDSPQFRQIVNAADLVTPDGMPLV